MNDWESKNEYPDLSQYKYVGLDTETNDPNLDDLGPGAMRKDGFLVGISIYADGFKNYYPIRHEEGGNLPRSKVVNWLKEQLKNPNLHIIGANIMYDLQWLWSEGIEVAGKKHDVIIRDALLDENLYTYDLDSIAVRHALEGKDHTLLYDECSKRGWRTEKQAKKNMWRLHSKYVGPYAEMDAELAYRIFFIQQPFIEKDQLERVDQLESRLTDTLFRMWLRGIPVDLDKAEQGVSSLAKLHRQELDKLKHTVGFELDVWSGKQLGIAYEKMGIEYERTEKGNPSFTADWLDQATDSLSQSVLRARQFDRSGGVFIQKKIINVAVNGRIHPHFKQTKSEEGGTRSGRLSSSNPNLQQVPARNEELSRIIRDCFIADEGYDWGMFDYSQQEPRVGIHFAYLRGFRGAETAILKYKAEPKTDYHTFVANMCHEVAGVTVKRKDAKTINLGIAYGMGGAKLCRGLGLPTEFIQIERRGQPITIEVAGPEGKAILDAYDTALPFVKLMATDAANLAKRRGYVKTILGRRCRFPRGISTHKAVNRIIQGSCGDVMKQALINLDDAGYLPYNTVHDETDNPISKDPVKKIKECREIRDIMLHAIEIECPLLVDIEVGPSWGSCQLIEID